MDDIKLTTNASGDDGINRITTALERLDQTLGKLAQGNEALVAIQKQMAGMQASITAGFTEMAKQVETGGAKVRAARKKSDDQIAADIERRRDRQLNADRIFEQSSTTSRERQLGVDATFNQALAKLDQARAGQRALDYDRELQIEQRWTKMLEDAHEKKLAGEALFERARAKIAAEQAAQRVLDFDREQQIEAKWVQMLAQANEKKLAAESLFEREQAKLAQAHAAQRILDFDREQQIENRWLAMLATENEKKLAAESLFAREQAKIANAQAAQKILDFDREQQIETRWVAMLAAENEKKIAAESLFAREQRRIEEGRAAARILDFDREQQIETRWLAMLAAENEKKLALEATFNREQAKLDQQRLAEKMAAAEQERRLNTRFMAASPAGKLSLANNAQIYAQQGGSAVQRYGSMAAGADIDALRSAIKRVAPAAHESEKAITSHSNAMREAHSLARGLAGSLGGLWLTYGSIVPLLAGAALAGSLKGVVEVGKEVEHQLNFVASLTGQGVNLNSFIAITDSSLRSVTEAANAMRALAQNGLSASQSLQVLPSVLKLATVGEMDVAAAALAVTGATAAFGLQFTEAERVADIFAKTAATSNTSVLAMTESMKQASTASSLFKVSVEETAAMLGLLAKINITGGAAGTSFTNLLTGLYEPTNQGKKALAMLGVEIETQNGSLKNYSQLMEELRGKLSKFNDAARVDLLGSIFTVRGVKAAELALGNLDEYNRKVKESSEASGFMGTVLRRLEDDTAGAFNRMGVAVQNTFAKAFAEAAPYVQQIGLHLGDTFKDGTTQSGIANLATNVARLTSGLVENAGTVSVLAGAYVAYRMLIGSSLVTLISAASSATMGAGAAATAATIATQAHNASLVSGRGVLMTHTAMVQANTAATVAGAAATRAWMATLLPALGALAVVLGVAAAAWLLLRDNTSEAEQANTRIENSLHTVTEQLDKEIERLKTANGLWDERNMKFRDPATPSAEAVSKAQSNVADIEHRMRQSGVDPEQVLKGRVRRDADGQAYTDFSPQALELMKARSLLEQMVRQETRAITEVDPARKLESTRKAAAQLREELESFGRRGVATDSFGNMVESVDKARDAINDLNKGAPALLDQLTNPQNRLVDPQKEQARIDGIRASFDKLKEGVNGSKVGLPKKSNDPTENQELNALLKKIDLERQLAQIRSQSQAEADKAANARGEIGDLALINRELERKVELENDNISVARRKYEAAKGADKIVKMQEFKNAESTAEARIVASQASARVQQKNLIAQMADDELRYSAKTASDKGQHHKAFLAEYELQYSTTIKKVNDDLASGENGQYAYRLQQYLDFLANLKTAGENDARGKDLRSAFDAALADLDQKISNVARSPIPGVGLASLFSDAARAARDYEASLPGLMEKQKALQDHANTTKKPQDQKAASDALKKLQKEGATMRGIWLDLGRVISKSLGDAFGKAGKALGGLIEVTMQYDARQKDIRDTFESSAKTEEDQRRAQIDGASARITAYGDMASAAKGFFDEGSRGYKAMHTAEQIFRAAELAMTFKDMAAKLFATETVMVAKAGAQAAEATGAAASTAIVVGAEATKSSAYGMTALAAALAAPFPANIPAFAAVAALLAAIGVAVGGGGSSKSMSTQRQEAQGTGTVLGDKSAKSESISRSLEAVEKHTYQNLAIGMGMLSALRNIESNIGNFASHLVRSAGLTGATPDGGKLSGAGFDNKWVNGAGMAGGAIAGAAGGAYLGMGAGYLSMLGGPITMVIGAILGAVFGKALGKISNKIFGGEKFLEDTGFRLQGTSFGAVQAGQLNAQQYSEIKTKGGWFKSDKFNTEYESLGPEGNRQISQVLMSLYDTVFEAGKMLELGGDDFATKLNGFVVEIGEMSFKDLKPEEIQKELEAVFSKVGDQLASFGVAGLERYQKVGEGYLETLVRVAQGYQTVSVVMDSLGMAFSAVGVGSIDARQRLIELAGGLEEFASSSQFFLENFFTEEEQAAALKKRIQPTLDQFGISTDGADPMKAFKDVVVGLDTTTESGAQAFATLMQIAPAFKTIADAGKELRDELVDLQDELDQLTLTTDQYAAKQRSKLDPASQLLFDQVQAAKKAVKAREQIKEMQDEINSLTLTRVELLKKERDALEPAARGMFDQLQQAKRVAEARDRLLAAYEREVEKLDDAVERMKAFGQGLRDFRDELMLGDSSPLTPEQKYAESRRLYEETLNKTKNGGTEEERQKAQEKVQSAAQAFLEASKVYNASGKPYTTDYDRVMADMSSMASWADLQVNVAQESLVQLRLQVGALIDISSTIKEGTLSIVDAINDFLMAKDPNNLQLQEKAITDLYDRLLDRAPDKAGLDFWLDSIKKGVSLTEVADNIQNSNEYLGKGNKTALTELYDQIFSRAPDQAGLDYWLNAMQKGTTLTQVADAMRKSVEAQGGPVVGTGSMSKTSVMANPYTVQTDNSETVQALGVLAVKLDEVAVELQTLRTEQSSQTGAQIEAVMLSGQNTAEVVASATADAVAAARFDEENKVTLQ